MKKRHAVAIFAFCATGVLLLAGAACTSQGSDDGLDAALAEATEADQQIAECMAEAGQDPSLQDVYYRMLADDAFAEAMYGCGERLGIDIPDAEDVVAALDQSTIDLVQCMEDAGWDVPGPVRHENGKLVIPGGIDANAPEEEKARLREDFDACNSALALIMNLGT